MSESPYKSSIRKGKWELRKIFNEERFAERAENGELRLDIKRSKEVLTAKVKDWIPGTHSQELRFYDENNLLVAKAHRYLRPDGKLAASGLIDPKRVLRDDIMYILDETVDDDDVE